MSKILAEILGQVYDPNVHWTSKHRRREGHTEYTGAAGAASSFTIKDTTGAFTNFLVESGSVDATFREVRPYPTYHLEVKSTRSGPNAEFSMDSFQFERV